MRVLLLLSLVACRCDDGREAPPPPPPPSPAVSESREGPPAAVDPGAHTPEQARQFREHRNRGRELAHERDYRGAIRELEAALALAPTHAFTLGELGWVRFQAGDLARAEIDTRKALRAVQEPRRRAPLLYNLGRLLEQRGDREEAIRCYSESLDLRPNTTVSERLAALAGDREDTVDVLEPFEDETMPDVTTLGPFATLDDACAALRATAEDPEFGECRVSSEPVDASDGSIRLAVLSDGYALRQDQYFAFGTSTGFWVVRPPFGYEMEDRVECGHAGEPELELVDLIEGGAPEMIVRVYTETAFADGCDMPGERIHWAIVCTLESDGPACWGRLPLRRAEFEGDCLATPMEASGECEDAPLADRETQPSPELTVSVAEHRLVIEHIAGPETARAGAWTAQQSFCGLPEAPPTAGCAPTD